jgi:BirA family biotin operon repressor/biotin-[acetyl-CoA-carboxylase] ligase
VPPAIIGRPILRYLSLDSTNDEAKRLIKQGLGREGAVIIAQEQSAGRGKPGAVWLSPRGGLYLSAILKPRLNPQDLAPITQLGARAVVKAIAEVAGRTAVIKKPNDVLIDGKKVCGILTERVASGEVIVGIGVNVENEIPTELSGQAATLGRRLSDFEPLLVQLLNDEYLAYLAKI